ncbi:MAG: hypothetical protein Q9162_000402 [Coniocarpon cinnabarinum]
MKAQLPVSSLRSAFEGLQASHPPSDTHIPPEAASRSVPRAPASNVAVPTEAFAKKLPPDPPAARRSQDITRPGAAQKVADLKTQATSQAAAPTALRKTSPPRARSPLAHPGTSRQDEQRKTDLLLGRDSHTSESEGVDNGSTSSQFLQNIPKANTRPEPWFGLTPARQDVVDKSAPPSQLPDVERSHARTQPKRTAPPVNRAAKPDLPAPEVSVSARNDTLEVQPQTREPRSSPFSTPPGSDEEAHAANGPPPIPLGSKPTAPLNDPFSLPDTSRGPRAMQHKNSRRLWENHLIARGNKEITRQRSMSDNGESHQEQEVKPQLPPRREMSLSETRHSEKISSQGTGRPSLDVSGRPSALLQGFNASSFPPRSASRPVISNRRDRSEARPSRRMSITPPPRAKPDPPLNKTFMKSTTSLQDTLNPTVDGTTASIVGTQNIWPDSSRANRRPPCHREGPRTISLGLDSRLLDAYGDYVCTTGTTTRIWHIASGRLLLSMPHAEGTKITALAFKPSRQIEQEGQYLWLATNFGELMEVEIATRSITGINERAHSRREVVKMWRKAAEIWSLDADGKLVVWPPNEAGGPNLNHSILNGKASRGVTSSAIIGNKLWLAAGKSIRVFQPNAEPSKIAFEVTTEPIIVTTGGDITSSTHLRGDPDNLYLGHSDGKISIYSRKSNKHVETLSVSLYKVSCLAGVGDYLWAGFNNGTIMLFDTKTRPWTTKKYWQPHTHPVVSIVADRSSVWKTGRYHVLSLGVDNTIGVWDGMLEDDWIEEDVRRQEAEFCTYKDIDALVMTWNAGAAKPADFRYEQRDSNFFRDLFRPEDPPDLIVFGFQELVDLEDKKLTAKNFFKNKKQDSYGHEHLSRVYREWRDFLTRCLDEYMPSDEAFVQIHTASLVGLFTCVFVKASCRSRIRDIVGSEVKTGMGGAYGNKAILGSETLPPGRRMDGKSSTYVYGGDGSMVMDHEVCILNGDLNYRIDTMGRETVVQAIKSRNLQKLLERDQLLLSRRKNPDFRLRDFSEASIDFLPTYKYDVGTDSYDSSDKKRAPAWCDRILTRGEQAIEQLEYRRHEVRVSDHRPVSASFHIRVKSRDVAAFEECRLASEKRFQAAKRSEAEQSK